MRAAGSAFLLALAACGRAAPEGQVIATVNGDEITRSQLNAALAGAGGGGDIDDKRKAALRNAVLDRLIAQQLVAQEAKRQGIDKSQDYLLAIRAAEDRILADMLAARVVRGLRAPYARDAAQYIRDNPGRFAAREMLAVDQIRYPADRYDPAGLKDARDLAAVAQRLTAAGVAFERGRAAIDSATVPPDLHRLLRTLPPGEPFVVTENGTTLASVIVDRRPAPVAPDAANRVALDMIRQDNARAALTRQLETLRRTAQIAYQPGFAAPRPAPASPAP